MADVESHHAMLEWPYPVRYGFENEVSADILVLGGGIAGCWAAISAARKGLKVAIVEEAATKRSGSAGSGIDHWGLATTNPACKVTPENMTQAVTDGSGGWICSMLVYIECREGYDTLLELEKMGLKIRDSEDELKGAAFRDEKTKHVFAYDFENKYTLLVWGSQLKPVLYDECKRLGVEIYDRVYVTSLLNESGKQGSRVVGATGVNVRTGEFYVFRGKATVQCLSSPQRMWVFSTELSAYSHTNSPYEGDGHAIAWKAGAMFTGMEKSIPTAGSFKYPAKGVGSPLHEWHPCTIVDAKGKEVPWFDRDGRPLTTVEERCRPSPGQEFFLSGGGVFSTLDAQAHRGAARGYEHMAPNVIPIEELNERIKKGEFTPPFYADLPSLPETERRKIFGLSLGHEGKTNIPIYYTYTQAGFDPDKDMLQCDHGYGYGMGVGPPQWRHTPGGGGLVVDWDLKTNLEGLYAAGNQIFTGGGAARAATTGRYAGRKAAEYALKASEPLIDRGQVEAEKDRVYAPIIKQETGIDWKELKAGICRVMQEYWTKRVNDKLLEVGLKWIDEFRRGEATKVYARNPHELMHALEVSTMVTVAEMSMRAALARKASNRFLNFTRSDYPEMDSPEWNKWIVMRQENGDIKFSELPLDYWNPLKENYEAHCGL
jgi:succinate dehydrogenase/fumarate reductase flavoprotein subunit